MSVVVHCISWLALLRWTYRSVVYHRIPDCTSLYLHGSEQLFNIISRADLVVQRVELIKRESVFLHRLVFPGRQAQFR